MRWLAEDEADTSGTRTEHAMKQTIDGLVMAGLLGLVLASWSAGLAAAARGGDDPVSGNTSNRAAGAEWQGLKGRVALLPAHASTGQEPRAARAGRLGGTREGFLAAYGQPVLYLGPDLVGFRSEDEERIIVAFAHDRAVRIVLVPDRPDDKPITEPDPADWSLDTASAAAQRFLPLDAEAGETRFARVANGLVLVGCSAALEESVAGGQDFGAAYSVRYTMPTDETVSAVTIALGDPDSAFGIEPSFSLAPADSDDRASASGSRVVSEQNGIRVTFLGFDLGAEGTGCPVTGEDYIAVEVVIENRSDETLRYGLDDFHVTDTGGRAYAAVSGGVEPAITGGELAPGETIRGWISFRVPVDAEPEWFVYTRGGSTMRFGLSS